MLKPTPALTIASVVSKRCSGLKAASPTKTTPALFRILTIRTKTISVYNGQNTCMNGYASSLSYLRNHVLSELGPKRSLAISKAQVSREKLVAPKRSPTLSKAQLFRTPQVRRAFRPDASKASAAARRRAMAATRPTFNLQVASSAPKRSSDRANGALLGGLQGWLGVFRHARVFQCQARVLAWQNISRLQAPVVSIDFFLKQSSVSSQFPPAQSFTELRKILSPGLRFTHMACGSFGIP